MPAAISARYVNSARMTINPPKVTPTFTQTQGAGRTSGAPSFNRKGKIIITQAGSCPIKAVELFSLNGQLLRRVPGSQSRIDLKSFSNRAIIVRLFGAAQVTTAIVFIP